MKFKYGYREKAVNLASRYFGRYPKTRAEWLTIVQDAWMSGVAEGKRKAKTKAKDQAKTKSVKTRRRAHRAADKVDLVPDPVVMDAVYASINSTLELGHKAGRW